MGTFGDIFCKHVLDVSGRRQEVWHSGELAAGIHHGRHTDTIEEGNGCTSQPEAGPAARGYLLLATSNGSNLNMWKCIHIAVMAAAVLVLLI